MKYTIDQAMLDYALRAPHDERAIGMTLVADDLVGKKLLAAFRLLPLPRWRKPRGDMPDDARAAWVWLWSGYAGGPFEPEFLHDLAQAAGVASEVAFRRWPSLMASRLVEPTGRLTEEALTLLRAFVAQQFPKVTQPKAAPAAPKDDK